ncbi:MAG: RNA methyltransferase [Pseudonocardiales bacterium]|nr:class I SAM-dependent RNA methyltransferase [Pseudonocardiales bacterium]PZS26350.1 MAG: RNA methyltransferase [Pseudonocardiales bacterium]
MTPDARGAQLELTVGPVGHGGFCVARHEGRVVFVRHALPGERVQAVVTEDRGGSYCRADAVAVLEPAAGRVAPPCPASGPGGCGGCDFQHVDPRVQRELKAQVVAEQLRRIAGLDIAVTVQELPGGLLGWRTRTRLAVDGSGQPGFRIHRSHTVLPVPACPLAVTGSLDAVLARRWRPGGELEVVADDSSQVQVVQLPAGRPPKQLRGTGRVVRNAAGRRWELSARAFWQVHPAAADALAALVRDWASAPLGGTVWDLYGGVGLFASVLAGQVGPTGTVTVVEASRRAVADGAAALADLGQVRFVQGRVEQALAQLPGPPDVVVLDPPRRGAGRQVATAVADRRPARIVHLACDPAALARDVAAYLQCGYRLLTVRALDAFPMTHHVECIAVLAPDGDSCGGCGDEDAPCGRTGSGRLS